MEGIFEGLIVKFIVSEIAQRGAALDWADVKKSVHARIVKAVPSEFWDEELEKVADALVDAAAAATKDSADLTTVLTCVAAKDFVGAEHALFDLIEKIPGGALVLQAIGAA